MGSRCLPRGLDGSGATATERRGLRGCPPSARGEGVLVGSWGRRGDGGRSVAPSSRGASALPPRGRCAEAARGFPLEVGEGTHGRLYCPPGEGRSGALRASRRRPGRTRSQPLGLGRGFWVRKGAAGGSLGMGRGSRPSRGPGRPLAARAEGRALRGADGCSKGGGSLSCRRACVDPAEPRQPSLAALSRISRPRFPREGWHPFPPAPLRPLLKKARDFPLICVSINQAMCGICFYNSSLVTSQTLS